uniref:CD99 antigen-like protein 2 n=2 Tax=Sphenodon punctatus TaxID=8508 RepID=A0A8D0HEC2_SPHPU
MEPVSLSMPCDRGYCLLFGAERRPAMVRHLPHWDPRPQTRIRGVIVGGGAGFPDEKTVENEGLEGENKGFVLALSGFVPSGTVAETGTIAGIASALAMALIGAVSSYISYQQKKFCFSIQQGLNAEYVKGENMEAVVTEEPQVKYSALETQSAEPPPPQDNAKV